MILDVSGIEVFQSVDLAMEKLERRCPAPTILQIEDPQTLAVGVLDHLKAALGINGEMLDGRSHPTIRFTLGRDFVLFEKAEAVRSALDQVLDGRSILIQGVA